MVAAAGSASPGANTAETDGGGASAAKKGKRPAKTPARPAEHSCARTLELMTDPVLAADGNTYEREAIETWLKGNDTSLLHGIMLPYKHLFP